MTDEIHPGSQPTSAPTAPKSKTWLWITSGIVAFLAIGAAIAIPISVSNSQAEEAEKAAQAAERERLATFSTATRDCGFAGSDGVEVLDGGEAVTLSRVSKFDGPSVEDMSCFLDELDAPSAIQSKIGSTRALDGVQQDDWDGYEIEWRYHPDDGATLTIEHTD